MTKRFLSILPIMSYPDTVLGAIMAVPGHDDRDYQFAKKFDLPIIEVVEAYTLTTRIRPKKAKEH